jgi:hypothetical protein
MDRAWVLTSSPLSFVTLFFFNALQSFWTFHVISRPSMGQLLRYFVHLGAQEGFCTMQERAGGGGQGKVLPLQKCHSWAKWSHLGEFGPLPRVRVPGYPGICIKKGWKDIREPFFPPSKWHSLIVLCPDTHCIFEARNRYSVHQRGPGTLYHVWYPGTWYVGDSVQTFAEIGQP